MSALQVDPARYRQAIEDTETELRILRESINDRLADIDEDERYAIRLEQKIAALRARLDAAS